MPRSVRFSGLTEQCTGPFVVMSSEVGTRGLCGRGTGTDAWKVRGDCAGPALRDQRLTPPSCQVLSRQTDL
jgi:hypothetical protein